MTANLNDIFENNKQFLGTFIYYPVGTYRIRTLHKLVMYDENMIIHDIIRYKAIKLINTLLIKFYNNI